MNKQFLPVTLEECRQRGWDAPDFVYVVGEAYVDHPSFGHAIISRVLEKAGYRVAMLCLPPWQDASAFTAFGRPRLGFLVTSGVIDSMVNHYTVAKKRRHDDYYAPGGKGGMRPDRATVVYCNRIRQAYRDVPILIGGVEASLRRFSHYDYWDDKVRHSVLVDSGATLLMYGMGEKSIVECANWLADGMNPAELPHLRGVCYMSKTADPTCLQAPGHQEVSTDPKKYCEAFLMQYDEQDPIRGKRICQQQDKDRYLIQNQPPMPLTQPELDAVYELPFTRTWHPMYKADGGVPALQEVEFSIASTRGCFGSCSFCAITFHQGRIIQSRSAESIVKEGKLLTTLPNFKGYIHDVGGPTANFRKPACENQLKVGACKHKQCLYPQPCRNMQVDHTEFMNVLRQLRELPKVKKVFVRSGLRYDYIMADRNNASFLKEFCEHHVSGQLKVAPEHVCPYVLDKMGKPRRQLYDAFCRRYYEVNEKLGKKQYLIPYLMSSHPGSDLNAAIELACYLRDIGFQPDQVQDYYPTPGTLSTCMFYTGLDPRTMKPVFVARSSEDKAMQRALMQFRNPANHDLVRKALRIAGREDLIGRDAESLVPPEREAQWGQNRSKPAAARSAKNTGRSRSDDGKPRRDGRSTRQGDKTGRRDENKPSRHGGRPSEKPPRHGGNPNADGKRRSRR
ncbi:MAG: YgiQ family radical SAM protein [Clostridia bacterium]|nr:YgiQ family radical SAM protein [Clostridia bacterium]